MKLGQTKKQSQLRRDVNGVMADKHIIMNTCNMSENEWSELFFEAGTHLAEYYEDEFGINPTHTPLFWDWFLVAKATFDKDFVRFAIGSTHYRDELFIALKEKIFKSEYLRFLNHEL